VRLTLLSNLFLINNHIVSRCIEKVMTAALAILAIETAISLVTTSSGNGFVTSAFAVKKDTDKNGITSKSGTSNAGGSTTTGSKTKFIKCVTAIQERVL
jgi:hypothetical protein